MVMALNSVDIKKINRRLIKVFGTKKLTPHKDPIGELVRTILSQNTSDANRDKAYKRLKEKFPAWEELYTARVDSIRAAIKPAGLSSIKAPRIKNILKHLSNGDGNPDLSKLSKKSVKEGLKYLTSFKGVGNKTAACVLLFSFGKKVFPVDTHIYRVSQRLGLVPDSCGRDKAFEILNEIIPPNLYYQLHLNFIDLGRNVCKPKKPLCDECILSDICPSAFLFSRD